VKKLKLSLSGAGGGRRRRRGGRWNAGLPSLL